VTSEIQEIEQIISKAEHDEVWKSYLFDRLIKADNPSQWLEQLKEKGYFEPRNNPKPYLNKQGYLIVPYWEVTGFLSKVSEQNRINPQTKITLILIDILENLINYKDKKGNRIENSRTDLTIIKMIFDIPIDCIKRSYLGFVKASLNVKGMFLVSNELTQRVVPYLIEKKATKILPKLLEIILDFKIDEKAFLDKFNSVIEIYFLQQLVDKYQKEIIALTSSELYKIIVQKIKQIVAIDKNAFSTIITIEKNSQNLSDNYKTILISLLRDLLVSESIEENRSKLSTLMQEQNPIFKRIALYTINTKYNSLKDIFWSSNRKNPLDEHILKHELYELFKTHGKEFTEEQILQVLYWIENEDVTSLKEYYKDNQKEFEISVAYHKKEWVTSLLKTSNPVVIEYHEKSKIFPKDIDHPGYNVWTSGVTTSEISREKMSDPLEGKSNEEIVSYLEIKTKEKIEPSISYSCDDLVYSFGDYVKNNSAKVTSDISPFFKLSFSLQESLFTGLNEAWKGKKKIDWKYVLEYCQTMLSKETFWEDPQRDLVVKSIAQLIESGTKDERNSIDKGSLPLAENVLLTLAENDVSTTPSIHNLLTSVINSNKGIIYSGLMFYSLRYAQAKNERVWKKEVEAYFENKMSLKDAPIELYVTLGLYLVNINYLDSSWVNANIDRIFPKNNETLWKGAITGYTYGLNKLYSDIYKLLKNANDYSKALNTEIEDNFVTGRLVEHICIAYLNGMEDIENPESLICKILVSPKIRNVSNLIDFVWTLKKTLSQDQKARALVLWKTIINSFKQREITEEVSKVLERLTNWITVVDDLDSETVQLLKASAEYAGTGYEMFSFVENLFRFVKQKPQEVGKIISASINEQSMLYYNVEDLRKIVITLYENDAKDIANEICQKFWSLKVFFLQDIYERFNKNA